ncbi:hypothetical protein B0H11DRAFT_1932081 [Mycena galericulata]|nr:hypothetical protein B0H11DRAFT_1932081 [Mycena galericulata]
MDDLPGREKARLTGAIACGAKASENKGKSENGDDVLSRNRNKLIITSRVSESLQIHNRPPVATDDPKQKIVENCPAPPFVSIVLASTAARDKGPHRRRPHSPLCPPARTVLLPQFPAYFAPTATLARPVAPVPDRFQRLPKAMQLAITTLLECPFQSRSLSNGIGRRGKRNKPENVWLSIINGETENYGPTELSVDDFMYWRQGLIPNSPAKPIAFGAMDDGEQDISVFSLCDGPVYTLRGFAGETMVWAVGWYIGDTPDRRNIAAKNQLSYPRCCADRERPRLPAELIYLRR